jgi:hypothetical protein
LSVPAFLDSGNQGGDEDIFEPKVVAEKLRKKRKENGMFAPPKKICLLLYLKYVI